MMDTGELSREATTDYRRLDDRQAGAMPTLPIRSEHNFRKLKIYQRTLGLVKEVYALTRKLPRDEVYGLYAQVRRAALFVLLNIAEGSGAKSNREFVRFLEIARGSLYEVDACLAVSVETRLLPQAECQRIQQEADQLSAVITRLRDRLLRGPA